MKGGTPAMLVKRIEVRILLIRGERVMLDADLAELSGVATKRLNEQVRRNIGRFPADFMVQVSAEEATALRSQNATSKVGRGRHRKYLPYAFTEQGAAMLSSVLSSPKAFQVKVEIMRTFVRLRRMLASHRDLARKLEELEKRYDAKLRSVFEAIPQLMGTPEGARRSIGFRVEAPGPRYRPRRSLQGGK
jgi:hypothetical protein